MKKVKTKTIYKCDRCGKEFEDIYCHMDIHLPYDLSIYHFCEECYKKIHDVMTNKDQKYYTKEIVYYPVYLPNRGGQGGPNYPVTYTTAKGTDGITINAKDINPNVITTGTINNNNNEINHIDNNVAKVCIQGNYY